MKSLFYLTMDTLTLSFRKWNALAIEYSQEKLAELTREFQQYSDFAAPVLPLLAKYGSFHTYTNICALFLPVFVRNGKLEIVDSNRDMVLKFITKSDLFDSETLENVTEINFNNVLFMNDESFLKQFPRLKILVIDWRLDDSIVDAVVRHFPELRVLDCCTRNVYCSIVTDRGLEKLACLKKLKCLLLDNRDDGYLYNARHDLRDNGIISVDHEDTFMVLSRYSGKGVTGLIKRLPELERFVCPGYLMEHAVNILKDTETTLPSVKSIFLSYGDLLVDSLLAINEVFPSLERICVFADNEGGNKTIKALSSFTHIKQLHLGLDRHLSNFEGIGPKLSVLELYHVLAFQLENLLMCGLYCPNVKVLAVRGNQLEIVDNFSEEDNALKRFIFPSLETLIYGINDIRGVFVLLHEFSMLKHFYYPRLWVDDDQQYPDVTDTPLELVQKLEPGCGLWPHLETFCMSYLLYKQSRVEWLAEALPSLELILMNTEKSTHDGIIHVSSRGQCVSVFDALDGTLPSRYPALTMAFPPTCYSSL